MFSRKSFSAKSFSAKSWKGGVLATLITLYNVARVYVTSTLKRTSRIAGKRTVTITEGVTK